jgi:hypothetical protein
MEPMVTMENIKMKRLSGEVRYIVALLRALARLKPWHMALTWDGGGYEGPAYLLSVCNSPRTGGFMMAPARCSTTACWTWSSRPRCRKGQVIAILLKLMRGEHIHHPAVTFRRVTAIDLTSRPGTPLHSDGDIPFISFIPPRRPRRGRGPSRSKETQYETYTLVKFDGGGHSGRRRDLCAKDKTARATAAAATSSTLTATASVTTAARAWATARWRISSTPTVMESATTWAKTWVGERAAAKARARVFAAAGADKPSLGWWEYNKGATGTIRRAFIDRGE